MHLQEDQMVMPGYSVKELNATEKNGTSLDQLRFIAFNGDYATVYSVVKKMRSQKRKHITDKYVLSEAIEGNLKTLSGLKEHHKYLLVNQEIKILNELLNQFIQTCKLYNVSPRQLFQCIIKVSKELVSLSEFNQAIEYLNTGLEMDVQKFPDLKSEILFNLADIFKRQGKLSVADNYFNELLRHPYLLTDRNQMGELLYNASQLNLKLGNVAQYKNLLFLGLRYFYTNPDNRKKIFHQIRITHRKSRKVIFNSKISFSNRFLYLIHFIYYRIPDLSKIKLGKLNKLSLKILLGFIYLINYALKDKAAGSFLNDQIRNNKQLYLIRSNVTNSSEDYLASSKKKILITRAMGGIGDLLMMTPGIHALKQKFPKAEINLAIPRRYFPLFEGNDDVKLLDIEGDFFDHNKYDKWFNFTDCPAARKESRTAPRVKKSRIEIFSSALNINFATRRLMSKKPRFFLNKDEIAFAAEFWNKERLSDKKVIGIQLHSDETYRDYPLMEKLVRRLSQTYHIILFDGEKIEGFDFDNVIKIDYLPIRKAFSLAQKCDILIAPDSSFVHLAAAFDIPSIALFGPIDGEVRTKHYPQCTYLSAKSLFGCIPCWRNESIPCKLTGMRTSECMKEIPVNVIADVVKKKLKGDHNYD